MTTILVVEDHPVFVVSLTRLLRERGNYEVATARTTEEAVDRLTQLKVDLALIDIALPGRSGIWLIKELRNLQPDLPCLMLSGLSAGLYVQQSMEAGARGYVLKDDVPGILDGIQTALDGGTFISEALRSR